MLPDTPTITEDNWSQAVKPDTGNDWYQLALGAWAQQQYVLATTLLQRLLIVEPDNVAASKLLGGFLAHLGRLPEAVAAFRNGLRIQPDDVESLVNIGAIWGELGRLREAETVLLRAISMQPNCVRAFYNLALTYEKQNRLSEAIDAYWQALQRQQDHLDARLRLGNIFYQLQQREAAQRCFEKVLTLDSSHIAASRMLGQIEMQLGQFESALSRFETVLAGQPDDIAVLINQAGILTHLAQFAEAAASYKRVLKIAPDHLVAAINAGVLSLASNEFPAAETYFRQAVKIQPVLAKLLAQLVKYNAYPPLDLVYSGQDNREFKERFAALFTKNEVRKRGLQTPATGSRQTYRIGFLVTAGHEKVFNHFLAGVINHLETETFEAYVICDQVSLPCLRPALANTVKFITLAGSLPQTVEQIQSAGLHLLYFWEVGTDPTNYYLPFFRLAPVQCTSWGTPETTGIPAVDYFVSSRLFEASNTETHYSEALIQLNSLGVYFCRPQAVKIPEHRHRLGLPTAQHIYYCAQNLLKYHSDFDGLLAGILRRDPDGLILIKAGPKQLNDALRQRWEQYMPDVIKRMKFVPHQSYAEYLSLMSAVDVLLDTVHYSGGTTSFEAIAVGTPVVTWPGKLMRGRMTYGCYQRIGVLDTVVWSADAYVAKAVQVATDRVYQQQLRQKILATSDILFEDMEAVHELERFFKEAIAQAEHNER